MLTANVEELVLDRLRDANLFVDDGSLFLFLKPVDDLPCKHLFNLALSGSIELVKLLTHLCFTLGVLGLFLFHGWHLEMTLVGFLLLLLFRLTLLLFLFLVGGYVGSRRSILIR